jgi:hypothetical protein
VAKIITERVGSVKKESSQKNLLQTMGMEKGKASWQNPAMLKMHLIVLK